MTDVRAAIPPMVVDIDEGDIDAVSQVLRSGGLREGPVCRELEDAFARETGATHAVAVSSGTAALHVAYAALIEPGDEVIVPSFTFVATASMVVAAGGVPVFCDVRPDTFTIDVEDAAKRVTKRTKAIAPVHLYGTPCEMHAVSELASEVGAQIVWDAAQAHGARFDGRDVGSFDDVVCYSFYPSKNMTTAEGGIVTTNDEALASRMRLLRSHGATGKYRHELIGFNYRLTDVMAALGLRQLGRLKDWIATRRANAAVLREVIDGVSGVTAQLEPVLGESSYNLFTLRVDADFPLSRDETVDRLVSDGIGATVHYPRPLHKQPALARFGADLALPVSESLALEVLSLPVHPGVSEGDVERIGEAVKRLGDKG